MANAFVKAQFMDPPGGPNSASPLGAVKAGQGIIIAADGTISTAASGGTVTDIICSNGIQGGGQGPQVFLSLLAPAGTALGGVRTISGSGISIDSDGVIRSVNSTSISSAVGLNVTDFGGGAFTLNLKPAGTGVSLLGGVFVPPAAGLTLGPTGSLTLTPATASTLGGIKQGSGVSITPDGTLSATGTGGTITGVGVGTGLGGGGTFGAVTVFLNPATSSVIGGVYPGDNLTVEADGRLNVIVSPSGVQTVTGTSPVVVTGTAPNPVIGVNTATTAATGIVRLDSSTNSTSEALAATPLAVKTVADIASAALSRTGGTMTGNITFAGTQSFPGVVPNTSFTAAGELLLGTGAASYAPLPKGAEGQVLLVSGGAVTWGSQVSAGALPLTGGIMTGDITFAGTQTFPGVVEDSSFIQNGDLLVGTGAGTYSNLPIGSDGQVLTVNAGTLSWATDGGGGLPLSGGTLTGSITFQDAGEGIIFNGGSSIVSISNSVNTSSSTTAASSSAVKSANDTAVAAEATANAALPKAGGTMTGAITFAAGQTISGYIANSLLSTTGDVVYASAANTPARLGIGAAGTILAVNSGLPAWRTSAQLGLLTSATAATTYAPLDSPAFTGPITVTSGGSSGSNAMTISGGNLVLATSFTPPSSASTGSVGELAWDNSGYLYFCYAPNTWGRVQIDLTPF
jgi:hypothetical protein